MKEFNLEQALAGKPVMLFNGLKAYIKFILPGDSEYPLCGYYEHNGDYILSMWDLDGNNMNDPLEQYKIVGMYETPKLTVENALENPRVQEIIQGAMFRNIAGLKTYILKDVSDVCKSPNAQPYLGYVENRFNPDIGLFRCDLSYIVSCVNKEIEEANHTDVDEFITVTLPRPLSEPQPGMYMLSETGVFESSIQSRECLIRWDCEPFLKAGRYFKTKEYAEMWDKAMRNNKL